MLVGERQVALLDKALVIDEEDGAGIAFDELADRDEGVEHACRAELADGMAEPDIGFAVNVAEPDLAAEPLKGGDRLRAEPFRHTVLLPILVREIRAHVAIGP